MIDRHFKSEVIHKTTWGRLWQCWPNKNSLLWADMMMLCCFSYFHHDWTWERIYKYMFSAMSFRWVNEWDTEPFNSHEWPRQNFPLQYQYNISQRSDENREKYKLREKLIQYQILQTNIMRIVWQTVRRITDEILGVKGLRP